MSASLRIALQTAARQHGVVATTQLRDVGISRSRIERLVTDGVLTRVVDGAYRVAAALDSEHSRCAAVCLARPGLTIAAVTAARLWGFRQVPTDLRIHVIAKPHAQPCREPWVVSYRTAMIDDDSIVLRDDGIRLTSPARTALDMIRHASTRSVTSMVEQGIDRSWFTEASLRELAEAVATPGRPFARRFLRLLDDRFRGGPAGSHWETVVADELRRSGIGGLERQHRIDVRGYGQLRFDLAVPLLKWAVEVDVHPSHLGVEGAARDKFRDRCCRAAGWEVHRVSEPDLTERLDATIAQLADSYRDRLRTVGAAPPRHPAA